MRPIFSEYAADDQSDGAVDSMNSTEQHGTGQLRERAGAGGRSPSTQREGNQDTVCFLQQVYSEFMETNAAIAEIQASHAENA